MRTPYSKLKIAIIEDDPLTCMAIQKMTMQNFPDDQIVFTTGSVEIARNAILGYKPDLLILDINLSDNKTAFDLLESQEKTNYQIIFVSSSDHSKNEISRLFNKYPTVNYLMKPINPSLLKDSIINVRKRITNQEILYRYKEGEGKRAYTYPNKAASKNVVTFKMTKGRIKVLTLNEIIRVESKGDLSTIFYDDPKKEKIVVNESLKKCEKLLAYNNFFRTHKQHIVNMDFVREVHTRTLLEVELSNGEKLPLGRRRKEEFLKKYRQFISRMRVLE